MTGILVKSISLIGHIRQAYAAVVILPLVIHGPAPGVNIRLIDQSGASGENPPLTWAGRYLGANAPSADRRPSHTMGGSGDSRSGSDLIRWPMAEISRFPCNSFRASLHDQCFAHRRSSGGRPSMLQGRLFFLRVNLNIGNSPPRSSHRCRRAAFGGARCQDECPGFRLRRRPALNTADQNNNRRISSADGSDK